MILRDLIKFIIEEENNRQIKLDKLEDLGVYVENRLGTGRIALERVANNTVKTIVDCEDVDWWLILFEFISPKYKKV